MRSVSRFEANLMGILDCLLQRAPQRWALQRIGHLRPPACLSRAAVELIEDRLGKGCVALLARTGWRRERHLRDSQVREGRLWERTPPEELGLSFSRHSVDFLLWLAAGDSPHETARWRPAAHALATGDRLLMYLALQALHGTDVINRMRKHEGFARDALCRLAFPDEFTHVGANPDWEPWTSSVGSHILEALQRPLSGRWLEVESEKERIGDGKRMRDLGRSQERVLRSFGDAVTAVGRRDLARFLLRSLSLLLRDKPPARRWIGGLEVGGLRLADRLDTYRAALALVKHSEVLEQWEREARLVSYFDEGYAASQLWKSDWEDFAGEGMREHARRVLGEIEPLAT
jgi:FtsH ternary system domain X6